MPDITILNEAELRAAVKLNTEAVDCIEEAFRLLATKDVVMPPILSFHIPEHNGEVDVKTAYVPGIDSFAIKMSPGFFDNPKLGLPSLNGLMVLFSAKTGIVESVLLDNGYLTEVRTAAAGAVAARWLSREDSEVVGVIGAGGQARLQLEALALVRDIKSARIWGRDPAKAAQCAEECAQALGIEVTVAPDIAVATAGADIVVTTTPSGEPLVSAAHLEPGQHVTAVGSDADYKTELTPEIPAMATPFVCDTLAQSRRQGELRPAIAAGTVAADAVFPEIGQVIAGQKPGRQSASDITVCDLTGTGVQDTAIANLAFQIASSSGAGTVFKAG